jgi:hypothetical protein
MANLKSYLNIVNLMFETEKAMGLESVTESDRAVLLLLWDKSKQGRKDFTVTYEDLFENGELDVSRAQFYKTMSKAKKLKLIERIGSPRSATYHWIG